MALVMAAMMAGAGVCGRDGIVPDQLSVQRATISTLTPACAGHSTECGQRPIATVSLNEGFSLNRECPFVSARTAA